MTPLKTLFTAVMAVAALGGCAHSGGGGDGIAITEGPGYYRECLVNGASFDHGSGWNRGNRDDQRHDDRKYDGHWDTASNDDGNRRDHSDHDRRRDDQDRKKNDDDSSRKAEKTERTDLSAGRAHTQVVFTHNPDGSRGPAPKDDHNDKSDKDDKKDKDDKDDKKGK